MFETNQTPTSGVEVNPLHINISEILNEIDRKVNKWNEKVSKINVNELNPDEVQKVISEIVDDFEEIFGGNVVAFYDENPGDYPALVVGLKDDLTIEFIDLDISGDVMVRLYPM